MNQAKMNIEMAEQKWNAMKRFQQTGDPMDAMMAGIDTGKMDEARIMKGLFPDQVTPQQPQTNIGMNYEEPTTPQVTFNGGLTGVPRINFDNLTPHQKGFLNKKWGLFDFEKVTGAREATVDGQSGIQYYGPNGPVTFQPTDSPVEYVKGPPINGIEHEYAVHKVTKQPMNPMFYPPKPLATEIKYQEVASPDKSKSLEPVPRFANPQGGMGTPSQAIGMPKKGQSIQFDNKETLDEYVKTFGSGGRSGGGIQTEPAERAKLLSDKDLADYIDIDTGKRPQGKWTQDSIEANGKYVRKPEKVLSTEEAAKLGNGILAVENIPIVTERLFPNGNLDPKFADDLWAWYKSPALMAKSEAASYGKMIKQAIEANVRLASGANVPPNEIKDRIETYTNQFFSSAEAIATGYNMLYSSLGTNVEIADPTGYYRAVSKKARKPLLEVQKPSLLPKGNGKVIDKAMAQKFLNANGNDPVKAREAAKAAGWKVQ